jgi:hypothetical protein
MRDVPHRPKLTTHLRPDAELRIPSLRLVSVDETVTQNLSGVDHVRLAAPDDMARPTHCNRSRRRLGRAADLSPIQTVSGITAAIKFV